MIRNFRLKTFNLLLFNCSRLEHGEGYAAHKHHKDKAKRPEIVDVYKIANDEFYTDKEQENANTSLEINKLVGYGGEKEEHSSQSQYGKYIGEEDHVGVKRYREDGRNAVECEYQVAQFDYEYSDKQRRNMPFSALLLSRHDILIANFLGSHQEMVACELRVNSEMFGKELNQSLFGGIGIVFLVTITVHLVCTINKEDTENHKYPLKACEDGCASKYENEAHDDGSKDTPIQDMLKLGVLNLERGEYHHHNEEIVYREHLFD